MKNNKVRIKCPKCQEEVTTNTFKKHVSSRHPEMLKDIKLNIFIPKKCLWCRGNIENQKKLENVFLCSLVGSDPRIKKFCNIECRKEYNRVNVWNKGNTKETCQAAKNASERMKKNNPTRKITADLKRKNEWIRNIKKAHSKRIDPRAGKTYEEFFGERAAQIKEKMSKAAKKSYDKGRVHNMLGKRHSRKTKNKIRKSTIKQLQKTKIKVSKPQQELFDALVESGYKPKLEHNVGFYSIDIAFPNSKVAIEMDGDFWHANEEEGFNPVFEVQKKNIANDKRKNSFLKNKGWTVLRFWQSDWEKNREKVIGEICQVLN